MSGVAPARIAAYETIRAVSKGVLDLPHALARARQPLSDERDRALAGEIATGTLRWQAAFDHLAATLGHRRVERFDPEVLDVLRTAMFQLLHLDRVPASAVVSDAVSLTKKIRKTSAAPLVNAVLRRVSRERDRLPLPQRPDDPSHRESVLDYLSTTLSHPRWLAARWLDRYGYEATEAWLRFNNSPARLTLRVNRLRTTIPDVMTALAAHGVQVERGRHAPEALVVTAGNPLLTPLADQGLFFVQDEASQLVATLVEARPGDRVLDACASPGGKTTAIAATMHDRGLIVATDVRDKRLDLLRRTITVSGASSIRIVRADITQSLPFRHLFDWILLDAPCSGLGTIRRDPDVRWRRQEGDLPSLALAQQQMLRETARMLRSGGSLVYSTCSSEPEENEDVVAAAVREGLLEPTGSNLRTFPFTHGLEAFFAAILRKP